MTFFSRTKILAASKKCFAMADSSDSAAASEQFSGVDMETEMNLALLDPPRFGWSVTGGIVDVLPPQEVSTTRIV